MFVEQFRDLDCAVDRHPAQHLGKYEVAFFSADLPDAAVGLHPIDRDIACDGADLRPDAVQRLGRALAQAEVLIDNVHDDPEDVMLFLGVGRVSDTDGLRALVARKMGECAFG